jgi:hypothetical protein
MSVMLPVMFPIVITYLAMYAIAGMAIGTVTGWSVSLVTRFHPTKILRDAFLGLFGFLVGFIGCALMPWPRNTVVKHLEGGGSVATTMYHYQHPERIAVVMAILLPLVHELYRLKHAHAKLA